ncbi:hypothetical protein FMUND_5065 [Fusarium mundagurra]|uniref:CBM-cenC domain-containing protein n=1 Tax=Fusarium mundagurra TaxID=1567541 RepID=A0A8H5YWW4_9HYPO|nr:hypothetical protein FMUND_5065 [Fusarium mundagurra]
MRVTIFALPLLAFGHGVLASPCKPHASSALSVSTTAVIPIDSTESIAFPTSTTAAAGESITTLSIVFTESSTESIFSTENSIVSTTTIESGIEPTTTSDESTTIFASTTITSSDVRSVTTSAAAEPQEPNLLANSGFEDNTIEPWKIYRPSTNPGQISIATDQVYEGSQSGRFAYSANPIGVFWGMYQSVDSSILVADTPYSISLRIRVSPGACNVFVGASAGNSGAPAAGGLVSVDVAAASMDWVQVTTTVQYTQTMIGRGGGLVVGSSCRLAPVSIWIDDVALRKI